MRRFAITFVLLLVGFFVLELTPPAQKYFVQPWTSAVATTSVAVMKAFDSDVVAHGDTVRSTRNGFAVQILAGCNGVEAMIVLVAGILAFPATWKQKLVGTAIGIVAIQALNLVRIVSLFYLGQWNYQWFEWAHLYVWQALIMLDAMIVWLLWMRVVNRSVDDAAPPTPPPTPPAPAAA